MSYFELSFIPFLIFAFCFPKEARKEKTNKEEKKRRKFETNPTTTTQSPSNKHTTSIIVEVWCVGVLCTHGKSLYSRVYFFLTG